MPGFAETLTEDQRWALHRLDPREQRRPGAGGVRRLARPGASARPRPGVRRNRPHPALPSARTGRPDRVRPGPRRPASPQRRRRPRRSSEPRRMRLPRPGRRLRIRHRHRPAPPRWGAGAGRPAGLAPDRPRRRGPAPPLRDRRHPRPRASRPAHRATPACACDGKRGPFQSPSLAGKGARYGRRQQRRPPQRPESLLPYRPWTEEALRHVVVLCARLRCQAWPARRAPFLHLVPHRPARRRHPAPAARAIPAGDDDRAAAPVLGPQRSRRRAQFSVGLSFGGVPATLTVPFAALTGFADPHVQFGLRFSSHGDAAGRTTPRPPRPRPRPRTSRRRAAGRGAAGRQPRRLPQTHAQQGPARMNAPVPPRRPGRAISATRRCSRSAPRHTPWRKLDIAGVVAPHLRRPDRAADQAGRADASWRSRPTRTSRTCCARRTWPSSAPSSTTPKPRPTTGSWRSTC